MTGDIIIDGTKDIYTKWGIIADNTGLKDLVCLPPMKNYEKNDWFEKDGIVPDLSAPVLNTRELTLKFVSIRDFGGYYDFIDYIESAAEHSFYFKFVDKSFTLRLVSFSSMEIAKRVGWASIKFNDDYPLKDYTYQSPTGGGVVVSDRWKFDGVKFTDYGITILQGSAAELMKGHAVKPALLRNIKTKSGAIYDTGATVTYKSQDVKIQGLLRASSKEDMWRNWYAFLYDITRPGEHAIYSTDAASTQSFCYRSCSISECVVSSDGRPWIKFTLTLTITSNFR